MGAIGRSITFPFVGVFLGVHHYRGNGVERNVLPDALEMYRWDDKTTVSNSSQNNGCFLYRWI